PQQSIVQAGTDMQNVTLDLQNLQSGDVSVVRAATGSISFTPATRDGTPRPINDTFADRIRIGGPGSLVMQSGGDISLGQSQGVLAGGDSFNASLPTSKSANVVMLAGVTQPIAFSALDNLYANLLVAGSANNTAAGSSAISTVFGPDNT